MEECIEMGYFVLVSLRSHLRNSIDISSQELGKLSWSSNDTSRAFE